jgi:hypothetical protein
LLETTGEVGAATGVEQTTEEKRGDDFKTETRERWGGAVDTLGPTGEIEGETKETEDDLTKGATTVGTTTLAERTEERETKDDFEGDEDDGTSETETEEEGKTTEEEQWSTTLLISCPPRAE